MPFLIREDQKVVGFGSVLRILGLQKSVDAVKEKLNAEKTV